jgi:ABC-type dipeptide/oligopeptide/nickel transport system permease subunit
LRHLLNPRLCVGLCLLLPFVVLALGANWIAPHDPLEQDLLNALLPPFWADGADPQFPLGTDSLGRDLLSRLIFGTQVALEVALLAAAGAGLIGTVLGLVAGFRGGIVDACISRLIDVWMSFPPVLLATLLVAVLGSSVATVVLAIIIIDWTRFCRLVRAEVMIQMPRDYIAATKVLGMRGGAVLFREILPNVVPLLFVLFSLEMATAVIVETIQSFLGFSVAGDDASWGGLVRDGRAYINQAPWLIGAPLGCIILVVLGFNALGDGLRTSADPVLR